MNNYLILYCENDSKKLKSISDTIIIKHFGWLPQKDYDDFYSIAGEVLWKCCESFEENKGAQFETYLINCLIKKFKTRITYMNRQRRNNGDKNVSLDALIEDKDTSLINLIASEDKIEIEPYSDKMIQYLNKLSKIQKKILFALSEGYSPDEIKRGFKITDNEFSNACNALRSYRNVSILY